MSQRLLGTMITYGYSGISLDSELDLAEPGLTDVARWRHATPSDTGNVRIVGGVGRKPGDSAVTA